MGLMHIYLYIYIYIYEIDDTSIGGNTSTISDHKVFRFFNDNSLSGYKRKWVLKVLVRVVGM